MNLFSRGTTPDPALSELIYLATRTSELVQKAVDRASEDNPRNAVGDAAEAVRCTQMFLHEALTAGRAAGVPWSELATYAGTTPEYLERAYQEYDREARVLVPVEARTGWRPLG